MDLGNRFLITRIFIYYVLLNLLLRVMYLENYSQSIIITDYKTELRLKKKKECLFINNTFNTNNNNTFRILLVTDIS